MGAFFVRLLTTCAVVGTVAAQEVPPEVTIIQLAPGGQVVPVPAVPAAAATPASTVPKTPEEKRLADLLKLKFDRSAVSILQAQTTLAEKAPTDNPAELFRLQVVAGRWTEAGAFLKTLPAADAVKVHDYLLKDLDRAPTSGANPNPQQQGPTPSPTLLLDDVVALAGLVPASLGDEQLKLLGALLTRVLAGANYIDPLLRRLEAGTPQLGGKDPGNRERAAQLLLNASRPAEALTFLPPLETGRETASLPLLDKHVRCLFSQGRQEQKTESIQRAWDLNQMLLGAKDCPAPLREAAWRRCGDIARFLPAPKGATPWVKETLFQQPQQTRNLLGAIAAQIAADRTSRDTTLRQKNLAMQRQIAEVLLPAADQRAQWQPALNLFAANWMEEADYAKRLHQPLRSNNMVQYDEFGNRIFMGNQPYQTYQSSNSNQLPAVSIADVLASAPSADWIAALDASLVPRAFTLLAELNLKIEEEDTAVPFLEKLAPLQPKEAQRLANETLRVWATTHDPQRNVPQRRQNVVYYSSGMMSQQQGVPLTRALQQRNLDELSALLARLRKLPIPALDDTAVVAAFTAAHSQAEVFRAEAIELVLGNVETMKPETLAELLQTMRGRLATQWRKPNVQQQAKTQRSDAQIDAEVLRGYELLGGLIDRGLQRQPGQWGLNLVHAATTFDWAEFQYGKKVDLAIYVEKRERAFGAFQRAAELYAGQLAKMEEKDETPLIYQQWLNANLGASDLALVTRQQEASANQIQRVRTAIAALPGAAAERHFDALAKAVAGTTDSLPAHLKPAYVRAALAIVGERTASADLRKLVEYYDGLLREIEFSVRVDGDTTVGHGQPFGVFCTVRHTAELERENAGGFGKYLRNQSQNPYYYNPYGLAPIDHRDELEKQIREKLSEGFEVASLTFHDEKVQSRGYGRAGWRETPLIYLLLKAKDASVDRLPALRLDLDFFDVRGPVSLPVESAVQLLDARPDPAPARPVAEIEAAQTLDDRELKTGKLTVEIKATGKGLIPAFRDLFDFTPTGFKVDELDDSGPAVQRLASEGDSLAPASERNWLIKLSAEPGSAETAAFHFPKPKSDDLKVTYKRYQDADLVEVKPELALAGLPLHPARMWRWVALAGCCVLAAAFILWRMLRRAPDTAAKPVYVLPATITPFTTLQFLRDLAADARLAFSPAQREQLARAMTEIETHYFAPKRNGAQPPDLDAIGREWITHARAHAS